MKLLFLAIFLVGCQINYKLDDPDYCILSSKRLVNGKFEDIYEPRRCK